MAIRAEFFVAPFEAVGGREFLQLFEMFEQVMFQRMRRCRRIVVRAPERFGNDLIHQAELVQVPSGDLQRLGCFRRCGAVFPQNRRAAFRADDRVIGVFQDQTLGIYYDTFR